MANEEILKRLNQALTLYEKSCLSLFGKPGKEGIERKERFSKLIKQPKVPEEILIDVYDFCLREKKSSRLIGYIINGLFVYLNLEVLKADDDAFIKEKDFQHNLILLDNYVQNIKREFGLLDEDPEQAVMMSDFSKR